MYEQKLMLIIYMHVRLSYKKLASF